MKPEGSSKLDKILVNSWKNFDTMTLYRLEFKTGPINPATIYVYITSAKTTMPPYLNISSCISIKIIYLFDRLIQSSSHCSKSSSVLIMDAILEFINQIFGSFKWLMCQCAVDCFMSQVQEQWLWGVMWIDQIHSLVCEKVCAIVSPLIAKRL